MTPNEPKNQEDETGSPAQHVLPSVLPPPAPASASVAMPAKQKASAGAQPPAAADAKAASDEKDLSRSYDAKIKELEAVISELQKNVTATDGEVATHRASMKDSVLARLNVIDKYRSFAPDVDPFTDDGKQQLEAWAADNPEILASRPQPVVDVDTDKLKTNMRSPHLVDFSTFSKSMKRG